jgi:hypothetical protein
VQPGSILLSVLSYNEVMENLGDVIAIESFQVPLLVFTSWKIQALRILTFQFPLEPALSGDIPVELGVEIFSFCSQFLDFLVGERQACFSLFSYLLP